MRVLIADFDTKRATTLADACRARAYVVERVRHGAAALEMALEAPPEVVVCPIDLPVIDGVRLSEILRGNPRTRQASFIFLVKDELDAPMAMDPRDATVASPWLERDILDRFDAILERTARFGEMRPESEIEGKLSQIGIVDLLQMFQMNRKTGTLRIWRDGSPGAGSILIHAGQVSDASIPLRDGSNVVGEKALYRLFTWRDGRFEFVPGAVAEHGRIRRPGRALLLEGVRQMDEWHRLRVELPADDQRLVLKVPRDEIESEEQPLTREVIDAVEAYRRVSEVVDHCSFPDYQVLRVLRDLISQEALEPEASPGRAVGDAEGTLFTSSQLRRVRDWFAELKPSQGSVIKVVVVAAGREVVRELHGALRECPDFMSDARLMREPERLGGLGALGHFPLGEGLSLRLITVPAATDYEPLWEVAAHGMLGAIVLPNGPYGPALEETEPAFEAFQRICPRSVVHLMLEGAPGTESSADARAQIAQLQGGTVFVLPQAPASERVQALRSVFSRLVP